MASMAGFRLSESGNGNEPMVPPWGEEGGRVTAGDVQYTAQGDVMLAIEPGTLFPIITICAM